MRSSPFATLSPDRAGLGWLVARPFAHRGLHGGGIAENSRSAFAAAIAGGHGIELDARLSRDGFAMVVHDSDLGRLTGDEGRTSDLTAADLAGRRLGRGSDRIEPLPAVLAYVAGRAPLLIELKTDDDPQVAARLCVSVRHALEGYRGDVAVMSFDPTVGQWFARHAPRIRRGLVVSEEDERGSRDFIRRLLSLRRAKPHFLAYDVRSLPSRIAARARRRGLPVLSWTVRTPDEHARAHAHADQIIFESP